MVYKTEPSPNFDQNQASIAFIKTHVCQSTLMADNRLIAIVKMLTLETRCWTEIQAKLIMYDYQH